METNTKGKEIRKIYFKLTISYPKEKQIGDVMSKCDLGIDGICHDETWTVSTSSKINKSYIKKTSENIKKAVEKIGGKVWEITYLQKL